MSDLLKNRAAVKALSRERDEERLRRGEVSPSELQRENLVFRGFRKDVIGLKPKYKPKSVDFVLA
ncbi:hypothetical protein IQ03_01054 [Gemmobacter caeni]|jgi:hypothetical protein|uniref:Uncharacterized protein n=1 Tax=Gemmobacter caeni TaxID=589035 RepID=A0A2T6B881_9RHOB|nr:hypothetical protein [Gemmobacter caeni]PTX52264.1 hypothetical protein C8N34_10242 [Gemmobacter caeni]TWJ02637.1 hypothetical protein IQ03_01054 [Gemmobacter caeni]